ncbi:cell division protein ZapB [Amphibiibacter pelophylacis]|uniref:Cell division protein ZapB n=1 Tax=Amphibiibacter pelophylacis TaxID=1799477 RepID=A0ACC6NYM3_9BURK
MPSSTPPSLTDTVDAVEERVRVLIQRYTDLVDSHQRLQEQVTHLDAERQRLQSCLAAARARINTLIDRLPHEAHGGRPESVPLLRPADPA